MSFRSSRTSLIAAVWLSIAVAVTGCSAPAPAPSSTASAQAIPATPRLDGADNFRDIGGPGAGYPTKDGKHVKRGVVYRSNALTLKPNDLTKVQALGITAIYDLRTPAEIAAKPDAKIPGATWTNLDVIGTAVSTTPSFATAAEADAMMKSTYRQFVTSADSRAALGAELTAIADGTGAQIIHCTAGKDRTGWSTALLLHIAGVSQDLIDQDYLITNQYSRSSINAAIAGITAQQGAEAAAAYAPLLGVQRSFLDAAYDQVHPSYGSVDAYLTSGLHLSASTIAKLKARIVA